MIRIIRLFGLFHPLEVINFVYLQRAGANLSPDFFEDGRRYPKPFE